MLPNVDTICSNRLCVGCQGMCPRQAIKMAISEDGVYLPEVSEEKCGHCGARLTIDNGQERLFLDERNLVGIDRLLAR